MKIICISGKAQHGKDSAASIAADQLRGMGFRVLVTHYADVPKYVCKAFFGWNGEKDEDGRWLLQHVGTDVVRAQDPNFWVRFVAMIVNFFPDEWDYVLIPDARFPDEIGIWSTYGFDVKHIRVIRPNFDNGLTEKQKQHPSETSLDNVEADYVICNDGTYAQFIMKVHKVMAELIADEPYMPIVDRGHR